MNNKVFEALDYFGVGTGLKDQKDINALRIVKGNTLSYSDRHRGQWFRPEYDFGDIQRAQDVDSLLGRSVELKATKFLLAGWEFVSENPVTAEYIKRRVQQLEVASDNPFQSIMYQTAMDLIRYNNGVWVYKRDENNSGGKSYKIGDVEYKPIAAIFIPAFETLEFKTKPNGALVQVRQVVPGASTTPVFNAKDIVHFWMNKRPGFTVGTPVLFSVLEDISLLRSIEQNVEELIQSNLFPLFHYKVGSDKYPARTNPKTGYTEMDKVAQTLEYMPGSGVYISDWRTTIEAIGSEGRALRLDFYLEYFKKRVMAGLGISPVDFGEGGSSNRSTAQTMSKALTESIASLQQVIKGFIDFYFIRPLLLEGNFSFDPFASENLVEIKFGKIDTTEQVLLENAAGQLWLNNAITHDEFRKRVGERPLKAEQEARLNARLFPTPLPATAQVPGAPGSTLAENQHGIKPKAPTKVKDFTQGILVDNLMEEWVFLKSQIIPFTNGNSPGGLTAKLIETWGKDASDRLYALLRDRFDAGFSSTGRDRWDFRLEQECQVLKQYSSLLINNLTRTLIHKIDSLHNEGITIVSIFDSLTWRINLIQKDTLSKAYNYGRAMGFLLDEGTSIKICSSEKCCDECKKHHGLIITRETFNLDAVPPSTKYGHPGCQCVVEKNE